MERPADDAKCDSCGCTFGVHWSTFNGMQSGCSTDMGQRDGTCTCKGFARIWRYTPLRPARATAEDYYSK